MAIHSCPANWVPSGSWLDMARQWATNKQWIGFWGVAGQVVKLGKLGKLGKTYYVSIWKYIHAAWGGSLQKKQWASWVIFWLARYRQCLSWISVKFDGKRQTKSCHWSLSCFSVVYENRTKALPQVNGCESKLATNWLMKRFSTKGSF